MEGARADFALTRTATSGAFRRPLDPTETGLTRFSAMGWSWIDRRLTLLGRVVLDRERLEPGSQADEIEPYPSSPFVTTDTSTSPTRRIRARLEGAGGWSFGSWSIGLGLGYQATERETIEAGLVRRSRESMPGVATGIATTAGPFRIGVVGRVRLRAETIQMVERAADGQVWQLAGYRDVTPIDVQQSYYRRIEEDVPSIGLAVRGAALRGEWTVFVDRGWLRERRTRQQQNDPALDRWNAQAWTIGGGYQCRFDRWLITAEAGLIVLAGDGRLITDSTGTTFEAAERSAAIGLDVRSGDDGPWRAVVAVSVRRDRRTRRDRAADLASEVRATEPTLVLEVDRLLFRGIRVGVNGGIGSVSPSSRLPDPSLRGQLYRRLIAPELAVQSSPTTLLGGGTFVTIAASRRVSVWIAAWGERLAGSTPAASGARLSGSRTHATIETGIQLR